MALERFELSWVPILTCLLWIDSFAWEPTCKLCSFYLMELVDLSFVAWLLIIGLQRSPLIGIIANDNHSFCLIFVFSFAFSSIKCPIFYLIQALEFIFLASCWNSSPLVDVMVPIDNYLHFVNEPICIANKRSNCTSFANIFLV